MSIDTSDGHPAMDYREHVRTYNGFIKGTVVLSVLVALILLGMLIFLV
ncbi:MAG TPA: aa3-type cytochrome c oxidase subunit IV [Hyphomicrobiaceae bacterium]|nr:aa3-type cytochrome c oxidase subunit IV [Hyphomicrobiaceae bacterium]